MTTNVIRFVPDNAVVRGTVTTSTTASGFSATAVKTTAKSDFFRSTGTTVDVFITFPASESIDCVSLPMCNLSNTASVRVSYYSDTGFTTQLYNTGYVSCIPTLSTSYPNFTSIPLGAAGFSYGSGRAATFWTPTYTTVRGILISINDASNSQGFIELAYVVAGKRYTPVKNFALESSISWKSSSIVALNDAGDSVLALGTKQKVFTFDVNAMDGEGKHAFYSLFKYIGSDYPVFISAFPEHTDKELEEEYTIYGRLSPENVIKMTNCNKFNVPISIGAL